MGEGGRGERDIEEGRKINPISELFRDHKLLFWDFIYFLFSK
jgi:hypothetical protein